MYLCNYFIKMVVGCLTKMFMLNDIHLSLRIKSPPNEQGNYNAHLVSHWAAVRCTFNLSPFVLTVLPTAEEGGEVGGGPLTSVTEPSFTLITMEPDGRAMGM